MVDSYLSRFLRKGILLTTDVRATTSALMTQSSSAENTCWKILYIFKAIPNMFD